MANPALAVVGTPLVALAYLGLGWAGISLAIPPGYASPIFPAAGFAVAIMLCCGRRAWLGIALGSLALNLLVAGVALDAPRLVSAFGIATGATLQALLATTLITRLVGEQWTTMESRSELLRILMLGGPLACLIGASVGVGALILAGQMPLSDAPINWLNWWVGDTLGVVIALPLSLLVLLRAQSPWRERRVALAVPMLITLAAIVGVYLAASTWEGARRQDQVREHGRQLAHLLELRFIAHQQALSALKRLVEASPDISYQQFENFTRVTLRDNPDIFALSFNPYVRQKDRAQFERRMAVATSTPEFKITERDAQRRLIPAGERPEHVVVGYIAPLEGNRAAIGFDINSVPVRQDAIRRARASRQPSITSPLQLVQDNQTNVGALLMHPVYAPGRSSDVSDEADLMGFAVGVIKLDQMVTLATQDARIAGIAFEINDVTERQPTLVLRSQDEPRTLQQASLMTLSIADRTWELAVYPTAAYAAESRAWIASGVGVLGLLLAAMLQLLLLLTSGQSVSANRLLSRQSRELKAKEIELQQRNVLVNTLFDLSPDGFVVFGAEGRVSFVNPAFCRMSGIAFEEVHGASIASLDQRLRQCAANPEGYTSIEALFVADASGEQKLELARPGKRVLQIAGIVTKGAGDERFACFRDITREAEIDSVKTQFVSHAAHELRTPMACIYGFAELLMDREFDLETRNDMLASIYRETEWLIVILDELLDLARIDERRGLDLQIEAVDLPAILDEVVAAMKIDAGLWPLVVEVPDLLPLVQADVRKLRQTVSKVLANAVKFSPKGGSISVGYQVENKGESSFVGIIITDQGIGMTQGQLAHIGERFYRADTSGAIPGSGLGLSIAKETIEMLGGSMGISSTFGGGTSVTLWWPVWQHAALQEDGGSPSQKGSALLARTAGQTSSV